MGFWSLIRPEATINLVKNPSFETGLSGWNKNAGLLTWERTKEKQYLGGYSGHMAETSSSGSNDDEVISDKITAGANQAYTLSLYYQRQGGAFAPSISLRWYDDTDSLIKTDTLSLLSGNVEEWTRAVLTATSPSNAASVEIGIHGNSPAGGAYDLYIDAVQLEAYDHATTYCDGEQSGCFWDGARHASRSYRPSTSRLGGREYNLTDLEFHVSSYEGSGTPPIKHLTQARPLQPGAAYVGAQVLPRVFDLQGTALGDTFTGLHAVRKGLIDSIKSDAIPGNEPILLRYSGAGKTVECRAYYDTGLDLHTRDGFTEELDIRLIAYDPFFYELGSSVAHLEPYEALPNFDPIMKKNGIWQALGTAAVTGGNIRCAVVGPDRSLYVGGRFASIGGITAYNVAKWDGEQWSALGDGLTDSGDPDSAWVSNLLFGPDGTLYAAGGFSFDSFTKIGIGKWDGNTWAPVGDGFDSAVNDLAVDSLGNLYAVGNFSEPVFFVGKWDGSTWSELSGQWEGDDEEPFCVEVGPDDSVYVGGNFFVYNPIENAYARHFTRWDGSHWEILQSPNGPVTDIAIHRDGTIYLVGTFTEAPPGRASRGVAMYRGGGFLDMQGGANDICARVNIIDDLVYVSGPFTAMGGDPSIQYSAIWTGTTWAPAEFGALARHSFAIKDIDRIYLGGMSHSGNKFPKANVVVNPGTRAAYPKLTVRREATATEAHLTYLKNETTGATVFFSYQLQPGEELVVNFDPDNRYVRSSYYGDVWRALLRSSDFSSFFLLPGENVISFRIDTNLTSAVSAWLEWRNCHWSIDGAVS